MQREEENAAKFAADGKTRGSFGSSAFFLFIGEGLYERKRKNYNSCKDDNTKEGVSMFFYENDTTLEENERTVSLDQACQRIIGELKELETFIADLGDLSFGRDYIFCRKWAFHPQCIMISAELTLGNIRTCCEHACFADANTLLRKYRDDLLFYLYLSVYKTNRARDKSLNWTADMEKNIAKWIQNKLDKLSVNQVIKAIGQAPALQNAMEKYNLKDSLKKIGGRLNDYVHGNGYLFYNQCVSNYNPDELAANMKKLLNDAKHITVIFTFLLILCEPMMAMSEYYIDCLDIGVTPPYESQYWVAPFVEDFIKKNISIIDANCLDYLKENTSMKF